MKRTAILSVALSAGFLAGCSLEPPPSAEKAPGEAAVAPNSAVAPFGRVPNLNGLEPIDLASYTGRVVMLDFWATWCPPCRFELPVLNRLQRELESKGLTVIGMTVDQGEANAVAEAVKPFDLAYPAGLAGEAVQARYGGIRAVPTKILLDRQGRVRQRIEGVIPEPELRTEVDQLLAE